MINIFLGRLVISGDVGVGRVLFVLFPKKKNWIHHFAVMHNLIYCKIYSALAFLRQARKKIDLSFTTKNMIWSAEADDGQFKKKLPYIINQKNEIAVN